jgi:predicted enzyme related to lactoylglutathione lyase
MEVDHVFAGLVVTAIDDAVTWYSSLFGRSPDIVPNDHEAMWQLAPSANLYVLADPARAGGGVAALAVGDLTATVAAVSARGIPTGPIEPVGPYARKAEILDPDGNTLALIEVLTDG